MDAIKVLVIDDSAMVRKLVTEILSSDEQIEVVGTAANALIAREKIKALNPDVLTLDVEMPKMDGLETTLQIQQAYPPEYRPRIIALTANAFKRDKAMYRQAGMDDYLSKPIDIRQLIAVLAKCTSRSHTSHNSG